MSTDTSWGEVSKVIDRAEKQMKEVDEMKEMETLVEGLEEVPVNDLTKAQVDEVYAELLAKGEAHLAGKLREYWARTHPDETMQSP